MLLKVFNAYKQHWSETKKQVALEVTPSCLFQRESVNGKILASYDYKDIDFICSVSDTSNGFVLSNNGFSRMHMFQCDDRENLLKSILDYSGNYIGISLRLRKESITTE